MLDLAVIVTSHNEAQWVQACLPGVLSALGGLDAEVVVAAIDSDDDVDAVVAAHGPRVRLVRCANGGFAYANNAALRTVDARHVLFLNPDTEMVSGSFAELLGFFAEHPGVGAAGVRQLTPDGDVYPTMRRKATLARAIGMALRVEGWAPRASWLNTRVLRLKSYEEPTDCDWTIGSFLLVRQEALQSAGWMDERFFFNTEEEDLCLRIRQAGWRIVHLPAMTIVHHVGKRGVEARFEAQRVFARLQYLDKNLTPGRRLAHRVAIVVQYVLRLPAVALRRASAEEKAAVLHPLRVALGLADSPFAEPPPTALGTAQPAERPR